MRKFFTVVAKIFASLFAILLVLSAILAILLSTLERNVFSARLYKKALAEQQTYNALPGIIAETLTTSASFNPCEQNPVTCEDIPSELRACYTQTLGDERYTALASGQSRPSDSEQQKIQSCHEQYGESASTSATGELEGQNGMPPFMQNLTAENWEAIIRILIPPADLQAMTENTLDGVFAYLNGETDTVKLSLVDLKARLSGPAGVEAITQLLQAQPDCTVAQLLQIVTNAGNENQGLLFCNPGEPTLKAITPILQWTLTNAAKQIPDNVTVINPAASSTNTPNAGPSGINDPVSALRTGRLIMRLSPLLPFAFLLLVTLFGVRSVKGWMRWWGIPFFFTGIFVLILGLAAQPVLNWVWNTFLVANFPPYLPASLAEVSHGLVSSVARSLVNEILLQAIILAALGLGAWIGSYFVKTATD